MFPKTYYLIVWFQKISIPPPQREFHVRPSSSPEFPFFVKKDTPPPPLQNFQKYRIYLIKRPTSNKCTP